MLTFVVVPSSSTVSSSLVVPSSLGYRCYIFIMMLSSSVVPSFLAVTTSGADFFWSGLYQVPSCIKSV